MEKIREVINKRIQEKKKNEFTDLAPIDDIENGAEYLKALHWAIKKKKVKNIALAGPYGAGKSSIIDTYLKKHKIIRSKSLRVSMATFVENETDEKGNPKKISLGQDVKEIILASNNTKEDVEQIMDLLERMLENVPEETEICLELVNHEEFCVDDISECCGKFDSNFDKGVKILWDELLDKGKVSLKWENIKCYYKLQITRKRSL